MGAAAAPKGAAAGGNPALAQTEGALARLLPHLRRQA
jgi:hypothetical protein